MRMDRKLPIIKGISKNGFSVDRTLIYGAVRQLLQLFNTGIARKGNQEKRQRGRKGKHDPRKKSDSLCSKHLPANIISNYENLINIEEDSEKRDFKLLLNQSHISIQAYKRLLRFCYYNTLISKTRNNDIPSSPLLKRNTGWSHYQRHFHVSACRSCDSKLPSNDLESINQIKFTTEVGEDDDDDEEIEESEDENEVEEEEEETNKEEGVRYIQPVLDRNPDTGHKLLVLHLNVKNKCEATTPELQLEEACALVRTLHTWEVTNTKILDVQPNLNFLFNKAQMSKMTDFIRSCTDISAVFLNLDHLKINQLAYFQGTWKYPVYDRYSIILQIFKDHAKSKEAKLQVALAEIPYYRHRLLHEYTNAENVKMKYKIRNVRFGGCSINYMQISRMFLAKKETQIKVELERLRQQRSMQRDSRKRHELPSVAVVGYTNSGKTTLIKALTDDQKMEPCNELFATLDVSLHAGLLPNMLKILYIDTIGFIANLPRGLLGAFSATLEDTLLSDVVIYVRDVSHQDAKAQHLNVIQTLQTILSPERMQKLITIHNKADLISPSMIGQNDGKEIYTSAVTGLGLDKLKEKLQVALLESGDLMEKKFRIPLEGDHLSWLYKKARVKLVEDSRDNKTVIAHVIITKSNYAKFKHNFKGQQK